jgi:BlaI family penicillinase repressor
MAKNESKGPLAALSRRERQCLDVLYQKGEATVADVMAALTDPPSYSAVPADAARNAAVQHLITTFFGGSAEQAMAALLDISDLKTSGDTLDRLSKKIQSARKEGR